MKLFTKRLTQTQMIVLGYCLIIFIGAGLLMLPVSTREGVSTPAADALFTSTSAACVTGLVIADTFRYWSLFGQSVILAVLMIVTVQTVPVTDAAFEVISAIGTVGMSTGITRDMETVSKIVLIFLMYCGRIGSMTFALSLRGHKVEPPVKVPVEQIMIG